MLLLNERVSGVRASAAAPAGIVRPQLLLGRDLLDIYEWLRGGKGCDIVWVTGAQRTVTNTWSHLAAALAMA